MKRWLTVLSLLLLPLPAQAEEACPPGFIHYLPLCLTETEFLERTAPPPAVVAPSPVSVAVTGVERWRPMVEWFWDEPDTSRMLRIMHCESRGDPSAYHPRTGVKGLFQIHPLWQKPWPGDYYDPWTNAAVAYQVWLEQGYWAWVCKG
jgi:hypothetical protein